MRILKTASLQVLTLVALVLAIGSIAQGQNTRKIASASPRCYTATIAVSNERPAPGETVAITETITNCDNHRLEFGPEIYLYEGAFQTGNTYYRLAGDDVFLGKGETFTRTVYYTVPVDEPSGELYTVVLRVLKNGGADFYTVQFTVQ